VESVENWRMGSGPVLFYIMPDPTGELSRKLVDVLKESKGMLFFKSPFPCNLPFIFFEQDLFEVLTGAVSVPEPSSPSAPPAPSGSASPSQTATPPSAPTSAPAPSPSAAPVSPVPVGVRTLSDVAAFLPTDETKVEWLRWLSTRFASSLAHIRLYYMYSCPRQ
jgi:hypothetical protein